MRWLAFLLLAIAPLSCLAQSSHWAFKKPLLSPVPAIQNPKSKIQNPIDSYIIARLQANRLSPSPSADRRTLLRRVTFDLTGLPPTPPEIAAFLADKRSGA